MSTPRTMGGRPSRGHRAGPHCGARRGPTAGDGGGGFRVPRPVVARARPGAGGRGRHRAHARGLGPPCARGTGLACGRHPTPGDVPRRNGAVSVRSDAGATARPVPRPQGPTPRVRPGALALLRPRRRDGRGPSLGPRPPVGGGLRPRRGPLSVEDRGRTDPTEVPAPRPMGRARTPPERAGPYAGARLSLRSHPRDRDRPPVRTGERPRSSPVYPTTVKRAPGALKPIFV